MPFEEDYLMDGVCRLGFDCLMMTGEKSKNCPNAVSCWEWGQPWETPYTEHEISCRLPGSPYKLIKCNRLMVTFAGILDPILWGNFPPETANNVICDLNKAGWAEPITIPFVRTELELEDGRTITITEVEYFMLKNSEGNALMCEGFYPATELPYEGIDEDGKKGLKVTKHQPGLGWMPAMDLHDTAGLYPYQG